MGKHMGKAQNNMPETALRYERKFLYPNMLPLDVITTEVFTNSFCFREIFQRRTVNNCYFDDSSMSFYHQNVAGDDKREKYRLRWYGDDFCNIQEPVIEIKRKYGAVGDKLSFKLNFLKFDLSTKSIFDLFPSVQEQIKNSHPSILAHNLLALRPSLFNSYERRYFLSHCKKYRITIDYNMCFYNPVATQYQLTQRMISDVVLELKYAKEHDKEARIITQDLRARLTKHSKYVRGIDRIHCQSHS